MYVLNHTIFFTAQNSFYIISRITSVAIEMVKSNGKKYHPIFIYIVGFASRYYSLNLPTSTLV